MRVLLFYYLVDVNECLETPDICGANSTCSNTDGSYQCGCVEGFVKDNCTDLCTGKLTFIFSNGTEGKIPIDLWTIRVIIRFYCCPYCL